MLASLSAVILDSTATSSTRRGGGREGRAWGSAASRGGGQEGRATGSAAKFDSTASGWAASRGGGREEGCAVAVAPSPSRPLEKSDGP